MYSECASLTDRIQEREFPSVVLHSYPSPVGRDVVRSILTPLRELLKPRGEPSEGDVFPLPSSPLKTREQVEWTMEVIGYGLCLPLVDKLLISGCVDVYEDWLSASPPPHHTVPAPIVDDPGHYTRIIFNHFYQLFMPRENSSEPSIPPSASPTDPQFELCQRVLQITHSILMEPCETLSEATWEAISKQLLTVADVLLSPPLDPYCSNLASMLSCQLIHVLFEAWLRACTAFFPAPHLWKSLRELCLHWRHHHCLAEEWSKLMYSLTFKVVCHLFSPRYLDHLQVQLEEDSDYSLILQSVPSASLVQCWFRMLHTIGNPVELSYITTFSSLPAFQKVASESGDQFAALPHDLPLIFHEAMKGVARMVYLFLGQEPQKKEESQPSVDTSSPATPILPRPSPMNRRNSHEKTTGSGGGPATRHKTNTSVWYAPSPKALPIPHMTPLTLPQTTDIKRPRGNTLLHLVGSWLFEAASWPLHKRRGEGRRDSGRSTIFQSMVDLESSADPVPTTPLEDLAQFEAGRAEALGALCAVFSSQPCGEPFLPVYLGWFYHSLCLGLQQNELSQGQMMTRILLNSPTLFRKGLPGINLLLPHFLSALDQVLPHSVPQVRCIVDSQELRHAAIQLLLSILSLPLHFLHQPLPAMPDAEGSGQEGKEKTFYSLRDWMLWLLFSAIEHEEDTTNIQLLLHGMLVSLQDIVMYENVVARMAEECADEGSVAEKRTEFFSSVDKDYGSASLFRRACKAAHWCLLSQEGCLHTSLAALELLQGLAQLQFEYIDHGDLKLAVVWVCDYIQHRAKKDKDSLHRSKDLHTSIVAAFSCLLSWVSLHPYLLGDKSALHAVLQVVELGISGSFSQSPSGPTAYKGEKELRPISGRVKDIAEFVLSCIMEQVGAFPLPCGAESHSSLLNEEHILARLPVGGKKVDSQFRYFLLDNTTILGLLEAPFTDDAAPSMTAVIRGMSGRHCWNMQLQMKPRSTQVIPPHPTPMVTHPPPSSPPSPLSSSLHRMPWPEEASHIPSLNEDQSIPSLDAIVNGNGRQQYEEMERLVAQQIEMESAKTGSDPTHTHPHHHIPHLSQEPPHRTQEAIETGRLFISHLSLLGIETVQQQAGHRHSIVMLDHTHPGLKHALVSLDRLPTRFCNTVFIVYCKEGCHSPEEILAQQSQLTIRPHEFTEFVQGLGWTVDPLGHAGFSGKVRPGRPDETGHMLSFGAQIPSHPFPYYADSVMEMAFIQPVLRPSSSHSSASLRSVESSDSGQETVSMASKSSLPTLEKEPLGPQASLPFLLHGREGGAQVPSSDGERFYTLPLRGKQTSTRTDIPSSDTPRKKSAVPQDCAVLVVWLERYEDHALFPLEAMSGLLHGGSFSGPSSNRLALRRVLPCIFIHMLPSGLFQVTTTGPRGDSLAGPLLEGMVVSPRSLSRLVRLTAANMCGRHRLDNEGYCPPHVKRKRKIEEIGSLYSQRTQVPEFYSKLLLRESLQEKP